jgi:O-antigen/teichoic acid export membrane protein
MGGKRQNTPIWSATWQTPWQWLESGTVWLEEVGGHKWLITLADQAMVSGAGFLTGIIIARACGKEQFGLYLLGLSILNLMMELAYVLIGSPYTIFSPRLSGAQNAFYTGSTFLHLWGLAGLGILALAGTGVCLSWGRGLQGLGAIIWMLAAAAPFILFRDYARRVCFAGFRMQTALAMDAGAGFIQIGSLLVLAYLGKLTSFRAFGVMGLTCGLAGLSWLLLSRKSLAFSMTRAIADFGHNWSLSKWLLGSSIMLFLSWQIYPWILAGFHGTAVVGVLAACLGVVALGNPLVIGSGYFLEPRISRAYAAGGHQELRAVVIRCTMLLAAILGFLYCLVLMWGDQLLVFFYGPQYGSHREVLILLAASTLLWGTELGMYLSIRVMGRPDWNLKVNLVRLATVTLGVWLVQSYGLLGVAGGLLLGSVVAFALHCFIFVKLGYSQ